MFSLVACFRGRGWRWPFRDADEMEVWSGSECIGRISAALLGHILVHYLQGAALQEEVRRTLTAAAPALPMPRPLAKAPLRAVHGRKLRGRPA